MPDSQAQRARKRSFDFDEIMSMLGEERKGTPEKSPGQEPAAVKPEPEKKIVAPEPPERQPEPQMIKTEPANLEPQKPAAPEPAAQAAQPAATAQPDNAIVDRLLADFAAKNEEILRLNNELTQIKFEVREKEQKIIALSSIEAVLDQKEEAIRGKDAVIRDKEESIKDKEATIKDKEESIKEKEAALKEKDATIKEKEALLKEIEAALTAKDNEIKAYEARVGEMEAKMNEMAEQLGTIRKLTARETSHEPFEDHVAASTPGEPQEMNVQESMAAQEDDVGAIFRRLAEAKTEEAEGGEEGQEKPRKARSAKLYDL
jgi:small-conductance mechanosensitive channel